MSRSVSIIGKEVTWTSSDSGIVVLDLAASQYYALNDTAALLWPFVVAGTDEAALTVELVNHFGIPPETAAVDVADLVEGLAKRGLVNVSELGGDSPVESA